MGAKFKKRSYGRLTALVWALLGGLLVWQGAHDAIAYWQDPFYASFGWARWYKTWLIPGTAMVTAAFVIWFGVRLLCIPLLLLCWLQITYCIGYVFLGPEGSFLHTRLFPLLVVLLSVWTIRNASGWLAGDAVPRVS